MPSRLVFSLSSAKLPSNVFVTKDAPAAEAAPAEAAPDSAKEEESKPVRFLCLPSVHGSLVS